MCHDIHSAGQNPANRKHRTSGSRYLHLSNVMDTKDNVSSRLRFNRYRSLETPGPGAVAHMSLHQNHNVKEPTSPNPSEKRQPDYRSMRCQTKPAAGRGLVGEGRIERRKPFVNSARKTFFFKAFRRWSLAFRAVAPFGGRAYAEVEPDRQWLCCRIFSPRPGSRRRRPGDPPAAHRW